MQDQGIAGAAGASVRARSVSGLGVCDVWRLELSAEQWPSLVDELEDLRGPLEEALQHGWAKQAVDHSEALADEVRAREYDLRLVRAMRAQLPARGHAGAVIVVGPVELVRELVGGTVRNVVSTLGELVEAQRAGDEHGCARLVETAQAAAAWVQTLVDYQEVEAFSFDPKQIPRRGDRKLSAPRHSRAKREREAVPARTFIARVVTPKSANVLSRPDRGRGRLVIGLDRLISPTAIG